MSNGTINTFAELTERQKCVLEFVKDGTISGTISGTINGMIKRNTTNISSVLNIPVRTLKRDLYALRDRGLIRYVGSNKTGYWEVVRPDSQN